MSASLTYLVRILVDTEHHARNINLTIQSFPISREEELLDRSRSSDAVGTINGKRWTSLVRMIHLQMRGVCLLVSTKIY